MGELLRRGDTTEELRRQLDEYRSTFAETTAAVTLIVRDSLEPLEPIITPRLVKTYNSIVSKLQREHSRLSQIQDIGGLRIVVESLRQQDEVSKCIVRRFPKSKITDRLARPQFGYRAIHIVVEHNSQPIEIQIRTRLQNAWSQVSEKLADRHGQEVKYGGGPEPVRQFLNALSAATAQIESWELALPLGEDAEVRKLREAYEMRRGNFLSYLSNLEGVDL